MTYFDVAGYTYKADNYRPDRIRELMIAEGTLSPGARSMSVEDALDQAAGVAGIDRYDESSFDSWDFPKVIFEHQVAESDDDWLLVDE